ncbi:MAG: class II fumarate hydratase [Exilibacterium sp.]
MSNTRIEQDSLGELEVPADALYAAQTQRAINNFPVSGNPMPDAFIRALLLVKTAAAKANVALEQISPQMGDAIVQAADNLLAREDFMRHFPVDVFQTGSGTSTNMNANEVLATLAGKILGGNVSNAVSPNDHVNCGQSSNDVIPTAIHISATLELDTKLLPALRHLALGIRNKANSLDKYVKTGRTHLMDAMPVRMSQALEAWAVQIEMNIDHLTSLRPALQTLPQGGTAVGTGINAHPDFADQFNKELYKLTGIEFTPATNFFYQIGSQDTAVALSGQLKTTAVSIMKIANDLRWMNSGPLAGLGEIKLPALQPGSSIMPGKVNPVIPEAAAMAAAQVIGNDAAITVGGQSGNFELNVMLPLIASNLLNSIHLLTNVSQLLIDKAIAGFRVNEEKLSETLARNPILVTALNPIIGYRKAAEIAKQAYREGRPIIEVAAEQTDISEAELRRLLDPAKLTHGGL